MVWHIRGRVGERKEEKEGGNRKIKAKERLETWMMKEKAEVSTNRRWKRQKFFFRRGC